MKETQLTIDGMTCSHCVMSVKKELSKVEGLQVEDVKIGSARVNIDETKVSRERLSAAVEEAGYRLVSVQ